PTWTTIQVVLLYTIPITYAGAVFTIMVGMIWSAVSSPRAGINSPVGLAPLIGVAPQLLVFLVAISYPPADTPFIGVGASALLIAAVLTLTALSNRLLVRERFLSPV
ncbi:MAG: hypothetical protein L3J93_06695, partial [Thermoplasmata archaeon]|nr:hypothetical protein [Thermoplasmata archaeon]